MTIEHKDASERDILIGDYVCYAVTHYGSVELKFGKVVALKTSKNRLDNPTVGLITVESTTMWPLNKDEGFKVIWQLQKEGREITISNLKNILIVNKWQLPPQALDLLKDR